jgi:hypothetical protein
VVTVFSGRGPSVEFGIKPDLVAVGHRFVTAGQTINRSGALYSSSGFLTTQGTSFSAPLVAGATAVVRSARGGLAEHEYRSLLANTATALPESAVRAGAGRLDLSRALRSTVTASPVSLSFGIPDANTESVRMLRLKNHSPYWETFSVRVESANTVAPRLPQTTFPVGPGDTVEVPVQLGRAGLRAGTYEGVFFVESTGSPVAIRVPYWFGLPDGTPARISLPGAPTTGVAGATMRIRFRVQDTQGLPLYSPSPTARVDAGTGRVVGVATDADLPGTWVATVQLDSTPGRNTFRLISGNASAQFSIQGVRQ